MWGPITKCEPRSASFTEEQMHAIAFGEAAYALVTQELGYTCLRVSIDPMVRESTPYSSRGLLRTRPEGVIFEESVAQMQRDRIAVTLAAPIAICAASDDPEVNALAAREFETAYASAVAFSDRVGEDTECVFEDARDRVGRVLRDSQTAWVRLADALIRARDLEKPAIIAVLRGEL